MLTYDSIFNVYRSEAKPSAEAIAEAPQVLTGYMTTTMKGITTYEDGKEVLLSSQVRVTSSYRPPRNYVTDRYYQVYARVNGILYTGRTAGGSMLINLKKVAKQ